MAIHLAGALLWCQSLSLAGLFCACCHSFLFGVAVELPHLTCRCHCRHRGRNCGADLCSPALWHWQGALASVAMQAVTYRILVLPGCCGPCRRSPTRSAAAGQLSLLPHRADLLHAQPHRGLHQHPQASGWIAVPDHLMRGYHDLHVVPHRCFGPLLPALAGPQTFW